MKDPEDDGRLGRRKVGAEQHIDPVGNPRNLPPILLD
jgi:hypothetical protein